MINSVTICFQTYFSHFLLYPQLKMSVLSTLSGVLSSALQVDQEVEGIWMIYSEGEEK